MPQFVEVRADNNRFEYVDLERVCRVQIVTEEPYAVDDHLTHPGGTTITVHVAHAGKLTLPGDVGKAFLEAFLNYAELKSL